MDIVFGLLQHGMLDYICCWFYKAALFCKHNIYSSYAFVSTNSITQGIQIPMLWQPIYALGLDIIFAYTCF